jgi:hypothetical protein
VPGRNHRNTYIWAFGLAENGKLHGLSVSKFYAVLAAQHNCVWALGLKILKVKKY